MIQVSLFKIFHNSVDFSITFCCLVLYTIDVLYVEVLKPVSPDTRAKLGQIRDFQTFKVWTFVPAIFLFLVVCVVKMWSDCTNMRPIECDFNHPVLFYHQHWFSYPVVKARSVSRLWRGSHLGTQFFISVPGCGLVKYPWTVSLCSNWPCRQTSCLTCVASPILSEYICQVAYALAIPGTAGLSLGTSLDTGDLWAVETRVIRRTMFYQYLKYSWNCTRE